MASIQGNDGDSFTAKFRSILLRLILSNIGEHIMKTKTMAAVAAAMCVSACASVILWTSNVTNNYLTPWPLAITSDSAGNTYQLYVGSEAVTRLRKLDPKGNELWQQEVGEVAPNMLPIELVATINTVAVGFSEITGFVADADGSGTTNDPQVLGSAHLVQFDTNGTELWRKHFGSETILTGMVQGTDDNLIAAVYLGRNETAPSGSNFSLLRIDNSGAALWQKDGFILTSYCTPLCLTDIAVHAQGSVLFNITGPTNTYSILLGPDGDVSWPNHLNLLMPLGKHIVSTNTPPNHVVATSNGFVTTNGSSTWENNLAGSRTWTQSFGSTIDLAVDATGTIYIPNGTKISKLASDGTFIGDITLDGQTKIKQIEWREDLQRLIVLSDYSTTSPIMNATITEESGQTLFVFDATCAKKASYKGKPARVIQPVCEPEMECGQAVSEPGESWAYFTITADKRIVLSGAQHTGEATAFAKAYKLP